MTRSGLIALWLVLACKAERSEQVRATIDDPLGKRSIDVTVTGAPISIRGVELVPGARAGELELGYRVDARGAAIVPARIRCRVGERNVVYPASAGGKIAGPRLTSMFRPDPFHEAPRACEIAFSLLTSEEDDERVIAHACFAGDKLRDGRCAPGTFPSPRLPTAGAVVIERAGLELRDNAAVVTGLFTRTAPLAPHHKHASAIRCEDSAGRASGEGELAFVPLDGLDAGESVYGPVTIFLARTPAQDARCELHIVSRATRGDTAEQTHARYCLSTHAVREGPCAEN